MIFFLLSHLMLQRKPLQPLVFQMIAILAAIRQKKNYSRPTFARLSPNLFILSPRLAPHSLTFRSNARASRFSSSLRENVFQEFWCFVFSVLRDTNAFYSGKKHETYIV